MLSIGPIHFIALRSGVAGVFCAGSDTFTHSGGLCLSFDGAGGVCFGVDGGGVCSALAGAVFLLGCIGVSGWIF